MPCSGFQSRLSVFTQMAPFLATLGWKILVRKNPIRVNNNKKGNGALASHSELVVTLWGSCWKVPPKHQFHFKHATIIRSASCNNMHRRILTLLPWHPPNASPGPSMVA